MAEGTVEANGITLWYETFGEQADPALVLIMGTGGQSLVWPEVLCERLTAGGRYVIRFDSRDTGLSQYFGGDVPYTEEDLADDVAGLLDALGVARAHIVGASLGGRIGQHLALRHPLQVLTLTSIMASPYTAAEAAEHGMPSMQPAVLQFAATLAGPPPAAREERIEREVGLWRVLWGALPFEEDEVRARAARTVDRAWRPEATAHHQAATMRSPSRLERPRTLRTPTLVIHGTADPFMPYPHGVATAETIPGAKLLAITGMGHALPRACWDRMIDAILKHTA